MILFSVRWNGQKFFRSPCAKTRTSDDDFWQIRLGKLLLVNRKRNVRSKERRENKLHKFYLQSLVRSFAFDWIGLELLLLLMYIPFVCKENKSRLIAWNEFFWRCAFITPQSISNNRLLPSPSNMKWNSRIKFANSFSPILLRTFKTFRSAVHTSNK